MLDIHSKTQWSDFNETWVDVNELENLNVYDIFDIHQSKMVTIAHTLCQMLQKKGIRKFVDPGNSKYGIGPQDIRLDIINDYEYLSNCSHGRLRELIKILIRET
jgi:hypothetical protein